VNTSRPRYAPRKLLVAPSTMDSGSTTANNSAVNELIVNGLADSFRQVIHLEIKGKAIVNLVVNLTKQAGALDGDVKLSVNDTPGGGHGACALSHSIRFFQAKRGSVWPVRKPVRWKLQVGFHFVSQAGPQEVVNRLAKPIRLPRTECR